MMRYSGRLWKIGTGWPGVCLAVILAYGAGTADGAPYVADTVEDLRQALKTPVLDPKNRDELDFRKTEVEKRVKALRPSDLRRALNLLEWRDLDKDEGLAAVDAPIRRGVIKDFMATMARILKLSGPEYTDSRLAAISLIGEMGTSVRGDTAKSSLARDLATNLAELVQDSDPAIRRAAARALGRILPDAKVATEALGKLLASNQAEDRRAAAEGLAGMLRVLIPVLKGRGNVSGNIMLEVETPDAVQTAALVTNTVGAGLGDSDSEVQRLTLEALLQAGSILVELAGDLPPADLFPPTGRKPTPEERKRIEEQQALIAKDRQTVSPLTEALEKQASGLAKSLDDSRPATVRFTACQVLLQMANARDRLLRRAAAIPALDKADGAGARLAPRPDGKFTLVAFEQAADAPKGPLENLITEAVPALVKRLRDSDVRVRVAALEVLISIGAKTAPTLPDVLPSLQDPSLFVRWATVRLLSRIGTTQHLDECIKALLPLLDDPDLDVRLATANALGGYGKAAGAARGPLSREVGIGDLQIANYVANWPPAYGTQRRQEEIGDVEMRLASIRALQAIGGDADSLRIPVLALSNSVKNRDSRVRIAAAEALGQFGPAARSAAPALRAALNDKDFDLEKRRLVEQAVSDALLSVTLGQ